MSREKNAQFVDPVCGMRVNPTTAPVSTRYNGSNIYFCAAGCKARFEAAPQDFIASKRKGFWQRYLERLNQATGGKPPSCCH